MSRDRASSDALRRAGRMALIDLVASPSHEARLAFPSLMKSVLARSGGRLRWAGSIDQQLIGRDLARFDDVLISEFPSGDACLRAMAERHEWQPESFVREIETFAAVPWSGAAALSSALALALPRLLRRRARRALAMDPQAVGSALAGQAVPGLGPEPDQLATLARAEASGRVVMLNFLQFRERARYANDPTAAEGPPLTGERAFARYGRVTLRLIGRAGGRPRWAGRSLRRLSGPADEPEGWSRCVAVQYPSRAAFLEMLASEPYRAASLHRDAGLERTRLLVCTSHAEFH